MTQRETALALAKVAGYHGDTRTFTRLLVERRVNRQAMNEAWAIGQRSKVAGVRCGCRECENHNPTEVES